jgi:hypothetical protein
MSRPCKRHYACMEWATCLAHSYGIPCIPYSTGLLLSTLTAFRKRRWKWFRFWKSFGRLTGKVLIACFLSITLTKNFFFYTFINNTHLSSPCLPSKLFSPPNRFCNACSTCGGHLRNWCLHFIFFQLSKPSSVQ